MFLTLLKSSAKLNVSNATRDVLFQFFGLHGFPKILPTLYTFPGKRLVPIPSFTLVVFMTNKFMRTTSCSTFHLQILHNFKELHQVTFLLDHIFKLILRQHLSIAFGSHEIHGEALRVYAFHWLLGMCKEQNLIDSTKLNTQSPLIMQRLQKNIDFFLKLLLLFYLMKTTLLAATFC